MNAFTNFVLMKHFKKGLISFTYVYDVAQTISDSGGLYFSDNTTHVYNVDKYSMLVTMIQM